MWALFVLPLSSTVTAAINSRIHLEQEKRNTCLLLLYLMSPRSIILACTLFLWWRALKCLIASVDFIPLKDGEELSWYAPETDKKRIIKLTALNGCWEFIWHFYSVTCGGDLAFFLSCTTHPLVIPFWVVVIVKLFPFTIPSLQCGIKLPNAESYELGKFNRKLYCTLALTDLLYVARERKRKSSGTSIWYEAEK